MHCLWRIPSRLKWVPERKWFRNQCYFLRLSYVWWQSAGPCQMNDIFINGHGSNGASGEKGGNLFIKSAGVLCKPEYLLEKSSWLFDTIQIWKCTIHSVAALNWRLLRAELNDKVAHRDILSYPLTKKQENGFCLTCIVPDLLHSRQKQTCLWGPLKITLIFHPYFPPPCT